MPRYIKAEAIPVARVAGAVGKVGIELAAAPGIDVARYATAP